MSELYVKWGPLRRSAKSLNNGASTLSQCARSVEHTRSALRLSDDVSASVKSRLSSDISVIYQLSEQLTRYSQALSVIAELYQKTEEENINR